MEGIPEEVEILRGPKLRVTTQWVIVDRELTPMDELRDITLVEADRRIRMLPAVLFVAGPLLGVAIFLATGWVVRSLGAALLVMAIGAVMYRDSWLHQIAARQDGGGSAVLYRTPRIGDARLFHAALLKAKEINADVTDTLGDQPPP